MYTAPCKFYIHIESKLFFIAKICIYSLDFSAIYTITIYCCYTTLKLPL